MKYIKPEHRAYYREKYQTKHNDKVIFSHEDREFLTAKMHRFNLFKRLDSSIAAFHHTLTRLLTKIDRFIAVLETGASDLIYDEDSEEETESASLDYKYDLKVAHLKSEEYITDLSTDRFLIQEILKESQQILDEKRDNKLRRLSFAHKRLNKTDPSNIVIAEAYCTEVFTRLDSRAALAFPTLVNRTTKRDLYLEAMTKALLLDHPKLFIGAHKLLDAKLWYRGESIIALYDRLTQLQSLKREKLLAKSNAAKAKLNTQIKTAIVALKELDIGTKRNPGSY